MESPVTSGSYTLAQSKDSEPSGGGEAAGAGETPWGST